MQFKTPTCIKSYYIGAKNEPVFIFVAIDILALNSSNGVQSQGTL